MKTRNINCKFLWEKWKPIPNYEGLYKASTLGRIKSLERIIHKQKCNVLFKEVILKQNKRSILSTNNYYCVNLYNNEHKSKIQSVHRILAMCFITNPDNKSQINHIDGNKHNNRFSNLEWCTASENAIHANINGLSIPPRGIKNGNSKLTEEDVIYIRNTRYKVSRKDLAIKFNISLKHVDRVRSKKRWKHI